MEFSINMPQVSGPDEKYERGYDMRPIISKDFKSIIFTVNPFVVHVQISPRYFHTLKPQSAGTQEKEDDCKYREE